MAITSKASMKVSLHRDKHAEKTCVPNLRGSIEAKGVGAG
jgi:hypothetical protein